MKAVRLRRVVAALGTVGVLLVTGLATVQSNAAWRDDEWSHSSLGTLDCADPAGQLSTRSYGRLLDGSLLPLDVDAVATVSGVTTTNEGASAVPDPSTATPLGDDAFVNPLDVSVLSLINLPLTGTTLADLLALDLQNPVGVVNQYAKARNDGVVLGASGVVNDSGAVMTANAPGGEPPTLGTLRLSTLVESLTGRAISSIVSGVTDLSLEVGAVAGRAGVDGCDALWNGTNDGVERDYAVAGLDAQIESPAVRGLTGVVEGTVTDVETLVNGLAADQGVVDGITGGVAGLLSGVLGALQLGTIALDGPTVAADLSAVSGLATATVADQANTVHLDLGTGMVSVDLASLIGRAYGGEGFNGTQAYGLNGLDPNTQLVLNAPVTNALVAALTEALDEWVVDVVAAVEAALYAADVDLGVDIILGGTVLGQTLDVATVRVDVNGTLRQLLDGGATVTAGLSLLGAKCEGVLPLLACAIEALVNPLVSGILQALTAGVGPLVGEVLEAVLFADGSVVKTLGSTLSAATAPVITVLSEVLNGYLGVDGLVALRANVQNDPVAGSALFPDWEAGADEVGPGRYAVAALAVTVLDELGQSANVNLELARGEVGPICHLGAAAAPGC